MDAMILAAGLGTRLGDVTRDLPKALVDVAGTPILEHVARRLIGAGADRLIINVHHHADRIVDFVESRDGFGVDVRFSRESGEPLETGGGLLHAAAHFRRDAPFLLHNVDVLCDTDLSAIYEAHRASDALATLAVSDRDTSRYLLFDDRGLAGRLNGRTGERTMFREPAGGEWRTAFAGIHVIEPALLDRISEQGAFSIMAVYARLAAEGERIAAHDISSATWLEIGNPERLAAARQAFAAGS
jgi:N-acetyl-alpha-D-muramate 1-phosphate uridylyltransferase